MCLSMLRRKCHIPLLFCSILTTFYRKQTRNCVQIVDPHSLKWRKSKYRNDWRTKQWSFTVPTQSAAVRLRLIDMHDQMFESKFYHVCTPTVYWLFRVCLGRAIPHVLFWSLFCDFILHGNRHFAVSMRSVHLSQLWGASGVETLSNNHKPFATLHARFAAERTHSRTKTNRVNTSLM